MHSRVARLALTMTLAASGLAACTTGGSTPSSSAAGVSSPAIAIGAREFAFDPSTLTVAAGSVSFHVTNTGSQTHEFEILRGDQVIDEVEDIVPGLERDLTVTLEAGDYVYVCKLPGHEESGMKGTLTVTGG